jgi:hypothetical protein
MFFFFHLLIGLLIGVLMGDLLQDRRWVIPCALGAVLPDLIDKPLGYLVFGATLDNGRIWFHTLLILGIVLAIGIIFWLYRRIPLGLGIGLGILSHQLLDFMWLMPSTWFYPALGPFPIHSQSGQIWTLLLRELYNPVEWVTFGVVALGFLTFLRMGMGNKKGHYHTILRVFLLLVLVVLVVLSLILPDFGY